MQFDQLIRQRKHNWERLEVLLKRIERDQIKTLSQSELVEFGQLYRSATSDLAIAQRDFPQKDVTLYLNQLVGRVHPVVYRGEPLIWRRLKNFYLGGLPQLYRDIFPFVAVSALLLFGPAVVAYFVMLFNPDAASYVLDPIFISLIKNGTQWWRDANDANTMESAFIMTHNLGVAFFAYAGGLIFGLVSVYALVTNGIQLGAVLGLLRVYAHDAPLWEFIIGHGVLELSEITMAGGSGLMLGYALLRPGLLTRCDALGIAAQKSIRLLLGTAPLLVLAGTIEGMISPSFIVPAFVKYGIGILSGVLLYGYLFLVGRQRSAS